jgi:hypothetical protein
MKLGNTSQSVVPVPNFFYTRSLVDRETFHISTEKRYFREKDLFSKTRDMNFCNNTRNFHRKYEEFNKTKYIPIHHQTKAHTHPDLEELPLRRKNPFDEKEGTLKPIENIKNMKDFIHRTNTMNYTNPELREEIRNNIGNLLDRINSNLNTKKFDEYDTKAIFNKTIEINYTPITLFNLNNESESTKFKNILKRKLESMTTIHEDAKFKALKKFESSDKKDSSNFRNIFLPVLDKKVTFSDEDQKKINSLILKENSSEKKIDFLSPTRREYADLRGEKISYRRKLKDNSLINFNKYNSNKNRQIYAENFQSLDDRYMAKSTNANNESTIKNSFY